MGGVCYQKCVGLGGVCYQKCDGLVVSVIKNVFDWVCLLSKCVGMGVFVTEDVFLSMRQSLFYF